MHNHITKVNGMWDTHSYYKTINHCHWSCFVADEYADLCAVECEDGRWFLVDDQGTATTTEILDKTSDVFIEPRFFKSYEEAQQFAVVEMAKITGLSEPEIRQYIVDDE